MLFGTSKPHAGAGPAKCVHVFRCFSFLKSHFNRVSSLHNLVTCLTFSKQSGKVQAWVSRAWAPQEFCQRSDGCNAYSLIETLCQCSLCRIIWKRQGLMEGTCLVMHHYVLIPMQSMRGASSRVSCLIIFEYFFRYRIKRCCLFDWPGLPFRHELGRQKFLDPSGFEIFRHHTTSWADAQSLSTRRWHHRSYTISFDKPQRSSITVGSSGSRQLLLKDFG